MDQDDIKDDDSNESDDSQAVKDEPVSLALVDGRIDDDGNQETHEEPSLYETLNDVETMTMSS
jgi:hypothetical protein